MAVFFVNEQRYYNLLVLLSSSIM